MDLKDLIKMSLRLSQCMMYSDEPIMDDYQADYDADASTEEVEGNADDDKHPRGEQVTDSNVDSQIDSQYGSRSG